MHCNVSHENRTSDMLHMHLIKAKTRNKYNGINECNPITKKALCIDGCEIEITLVRAEGKLNTQ